MKPGRVLTALGAVALGGVVWAGVHLEGPYRPVVDPGTLEERAVDSPDDPATGALRQVPHLTLDPGARCRMRGTWPDYGPDPACTPGALNPDVTAATVVSTICVSGWATNQRPDRNTSAELKTRVMAAYGVGEQWRDGVEADHLVPISLGGALADVRNLWPEAGASPNAKDRVEWAARDAVCKGTLPLAEARVAFEQGQWRALGAKLGVKP